MRIAGMPSRWMGPVRQSLDDFEIGASRPLPIMRKVRELGSDQLCGAADMEGFKELERRFRCSECGERAVSVEPIWHPDWRP